MGTQTTTSLTTTTLTTALTTTWTTTLTTATIMTTTMTTATTISETLPRLVPCEWSHWTSCNCDYGTRTRSTQLLSLEDENLGSKCETNDIEDDECEINSCSCRVVSHQCFPQWSPEYYSDYGSDDQKQCRVDNKDCQIQPDPRRGEKTWTECDETLCFDEFGSPKIDTMGACWTKRMECIFPFKDVDGEEHNKCTMSRLCNNAEYCNDVEFLWCATKVDDSG